MTEINDVIAKNTKSITGNIEKQEKEEPKKKSKKKKKKDYALGFFERIVFGALAVWILLTFVFGITTVKGNYMFPALKDGDLVITFKLEPAVSTEIIAYKKDGKTKLGRIVAMGGDTVDIAEDGSLLINGVRSAEEIFYPTEKIASGVNMPYTVPQDSFFVLNDYRTINEPDSRTIGSIAKQETKGKVVFIFRRRGF